MRMKALVFVAALVLAASANSVEDSPFTIDFEQLAPGVWAGLRPDPVRSPVMGNTVFVIGDRSVIVFDGGGAPAMSDLVIEKIRSLTDLPVSDVVISHWHGDHAFGIHRFAEEYPGVRIVAHEFTRDMMISSRMNYLDGQRDFQNDVVPLLQSFIDEGKTSSGRVLNEHDIAFFRQIIADGEYIEVEGRRSRVTPPDTVFTDAMTLDAGGRTVELRFLGHGNTEGDIVLWLPEERIIATGDIVVHPAPYAFNMPPIPWANTLRAIKDLDYAVLVPGHGEVQRDTAYVDLLIESAVDIAAQRDALIADGTPIEEVAAALEFSHLEPKFTGGDPYIKVPYDSYFDRQFRLAAVKALTAERMVDIPEPELIPFDDERWQIEAAVAEKQEYLGASALKLQGGGATLNDIDVANAVVEFDIATDGERGFAGLVFRLQDPGNFEHFYIRPHQSGNPDANQYQPVFNGVAAWQLYHGDGFSVPVEYRNNEWMHVKVIFAGDEARVYIDSDEPVLVVNDLKREERGGTIGVQAANFAPVHFANFRYMKLSDAFAFAPVPRESTAAPEGVVRRWDVLQSVWPGGSCRRQRLTCRRYVEP